MLGRYRLWFAFDVFVVVDDLARYLATPEADDDAMHGRYTLGLIAPAEGAVGEVDVDALSE